MAPELSAWERFVIVVVREDRDTWRFATDELEHKHYLAERKNCCFDPILAVAPL